MTTERTARGLGKGLSALLYAALMIVAIVAMPRGIAGAIESLKIYAAKRLAVSSSTRLTVSSRTK